MRRRHAETGHGGGGMERWLLTYADMITLLLALFILLFSIATTHTPQFGQVASSVRKAFSAPSGASRVDIRHRGPGPLGPGPRPLQSELPPAPVKLAQDTIPQGKLVQALRDAGLQLHVHVVQANTGILIRLKDDVFFDTGTADIRPEALPVLQKLAAFLMSLQGYTAAVQGYTDSRPIFTPQFPSNWELSSARALSVVHALIDDGVDASMLSVGGNAENRPVATNGTPEGQAENRRVEVVIGRVVETVGP